MIAHLMLSFLSSDPSLGRVDKNVLSQQTVMELFTENITNRKRVCGSNEHPTEISAWKGLTFNESNEIIELDWGFMFLAGPIELKWLPCTLKECFLNINRLCGTVDLTCLPDGLEKLLLAGNKFEGTVDLTNLPAGLKTLGLSGNAFTGHTDFSQLPKELNALNVSRTNLEGEIHAFDGEFRGEKCKVVDMRKG